ncbi:phosphoadenosine phosphosulfate reductase [Aliiroseovarius crassostreae]|uniref:phosphoadenosine phosphosulfate reductase n=1 Tax=Aliiroseovarius crassostreae TaxID=154981 RepID=UPI00220529E4|nr:phosphoadenosine phosphosulfate reductase [Aliiroseovarius crassostreae]UWQ10152.1 phosphoadenosine phosphosulfate reductase [Aliiroseovarius crassostreae]
MMDDTPTQADERVQRECDLAGADFDKWLSMIDEMGEERGYFEPVGQRHSAILTDDGPTLVVTFETAKSVRQSKEARPLGWDLAEENGWSNLCILAHEESWFRDQDLYGYFDRLVDDGFFEDFDQVVFYGAGPSGYAACAYSVAAPGATVIAISPQATLDMTRVAWDRRFPKMRRTDFTTRYGYAPDMVEGAEAVYLLHDPAIAEDAMHASLFQADHIHHLTCRHMGDTLVEELWSMAALPQMIEAATEGQLSPHVARNILRNRRTHLPYLRRLLDRLQQTDRPRLVAALSRHVTDRRGAPRFRKALTEAERTLEDA